MHIPKEIRIGSCNYNVEFTDSTLVVDGKECSATINYNYHLISINNSIGDNQKNEISFLHELFHGMVHERNIALDNEELVVEELARCMHQVIKDNPNIFKVREESLW